MTRRRRHPQRGELVTARCKPSALLLGKAPCTGSVPRLGRKILEGHATPQRARPLGRPGRSPENSRRRYASVRVSRSGSRPKVDAVVQTRLEASLPPESKVRTRRRREGQIGRVRRNKHLAPSQKRLPRRAQRMVAPGRNDDARRIGSRAARSGNTRHEQPLLAPLRRAFETADGSPRGGRTPGTVR